MSIAVWQAGWCDGTGQLLGFAPDLSFWGLARSEGLSGTYCNGGIHVHRLDSILSVVTDVKMEDPACLSPVNDNLLLVHSSRSNSADRAADASREHPFSSGHLSDGYTPFPEDIRSSGETLMGGSRTAGGIPAVPGADRNRFAVVAPAYNEGLVIGSIILQARRHAERVIVVDDGSSDRTAETARLAGADVIRMPKNGGKAKAMMAGFARARELGYDAVVMLDGDGQHDPDEIPAVVAPVLAGVADLVIGSRFLDTRAEIPAYRRAGQLVLTGFTNLSVNGGTFATTDSQSGFRALSRRALDNLNFSSEGYNIESDMIAHFASLDLRVTEVPISVTYDVPHKHKKNPISHGFGVLARIVGLIGYKKPLLFFGIPGGVIALLGIALEIYTFSEFFRINQFHYILFTAGMTALILGLLLVSSGLILNFLVSMIERRVGKT